MWWWQWSLQILTDISSSILPQHLEHEALDRVVIVQLLVSSVSMDIVDNC